MLETFIGWACSHPLSIVIDMGTSLGYFLHDINSQLNYVVPLISWWHTLFIHGNFWEVVFKVCSPFKGLCTPLLELFKVVVDLEEDKEDCMDDKLCFFGYCSQAISCQS
jgi:hypothetical protein